MDTSEAGVATEPWTNLYVLLTFPSPSAAGLRVAAQLLWFENICFALYASYRHERLAIQQSVPHAQSYLRHP